MDTPPNNSVNDSSKEQQTDAPSFEKTLARLEEIVRFLEEGQIGLDESLAGYEEGVGLLRKAYEVLEKAERRISLLSGVDPAGNPILQPMEDSASFSLERETTRAQPIVGSGEKISVRRGRRQAGQDTP
jgi:exodeoxyribonuclease VII small subunit